MKKTVIVLAAIMGVALAAGQALAQDAAVAGFWFGEKAKTELWFGQGRFAYYMTDLGPYARGTYAISGKDSVLLKADGFYWGDVWKMAWKNKNAAEGWYSPEEFASSIGISLKELDKVTQGLVSGVKATYKIKKGLLDMKYGYLRYNGFALKGEADPYAPPEDAGLQPDAEKPEE